MPRVGRGEEMMARRGDGIYQRGRFEELGEGERVMKWLNVAGGVRSSLIVVTTAGLVAGCASAANWQPPVEAAFAACKAEGRVAEGISLEPVGSGYQIRGGPAGRGDLEACMRAKLR
jgi:hypothetical protein